MSVNKQERLNTIRKGIEEFSKEGGNIEARLETINKEIEKLSKESKSIKAKLQSCIKFLPVDVVADKQKEIKQYQLTMQRNELEMQFEQASIKRLKLRIEHCKLKQNISNNSTENKALDKEIKCYTNAITLSERFISVHYKPAIERDRQAIKSCEQEINDHENQAVISTNSISETYVANAIPSNNKKENGILQPCSHQDHQDHQVSDNKLNIRALIYNVLHYFISGEVFNNSKLKRCDNNVSQSIKTVVSDKNKTNNKFDISMSSAQAQAHQKSGSTLFSRSNHTVATNADANTGGIELHGMNNN